MNISVGELSQIDSSSSASATPRDHASFTRSEGSPSEPSNQTSGANSFEDTVTGSEMGSQFMDDDDCSDDNF